MNTKKIINVSLNSNNNISTSAGSGFTNATNQFFTTAESSVYSPLQINSLILINDTPLNVSAITQRFISNKNFVGTATQSTNTLTIVTNTGDPVYVGAVITFNAQVMYITALGTGTGGAGTYSVSVSQSVVTATAFTGTYSLGLYSVVSATAVGSLTSPLAYTANPMQISDRTYYLDWSTILEQGKTYKLHFTFISSGNFVFNATTIQSTKIGQLYVEMPTINNYFNQYNSNYAMNTNCVGFIMPTIYQGSSAMGYYQCLDNTNLPIYLWGRPTTNQFRVYLLDNGASQLPFTDNSSFTGTATQSGTTLTIVTSTAGGNNLTIGSKITLNSLTMTITGFGTGAGGVGTYIVNQSQSVGTASAFTGIGGKLGDYVLTLSFHEL